MHIDPTLRSVGRTPARLLHCWQRLLQRLPQRVVELLPDGQAWPWQTAQSLAIVFEGCAAHRLDRPHRQIYISEAETAQMGDDAVEHLLCKQLAQEVCWALGIEGLLPDDALQRMADGWLASRAE